MAKKKAAKKKPAAAKKVTKKVTKKAAKKVARKPRGPREDNISVTNVISGPVKKAKK